MNEEQRILWGKKYNFETQQIIMDKISMAEDRFDEEYFSGIDEGATLNELENLNKPIAFSNLYNQYLNEGFIQQTIEEDGSYGYSLRVNYEPSAFVCNEKGFVIIEGDLYHYTQHGVNSKVYENPNDKTLMLSKQQKSSSIMGLNDFYIDNIFTAQGTPGNKTWYYDSAKHRFYHYVWFRSSELTTHKMQSIFITLSKAERKRWGKWKTRNNYLPITNITGDWDYSWDYWLNGNTFSFSNVFSPCTNSSPIYMRGPSNHRGGYLCPSGLITSPYQIADPMRIFGMHIQGNFNGETDTYQTNYYH
ncbi:MAG: hypothetical protein COA88_06355 [Kordia sp.]|nr:MAG: hypothetical protein COA88_06355 [Kordia sp.]